MADNNKAPVDAVGGTQEVGPWPSEVEEIVQGETYRREVVDSDGNRRELDVEVTEVSDVTDDAGDPTGGKVVARQFDDPTLDGGA